MHFGTQTVLYGLFGLPLVCLFYLWVFRRKKSLLSRMGKWELVQRLIDSTSKTKQLIKAGILVVCISLLIFSLSRPQYGSIERPITRKGVDMYIAIDTSLSMMAEDIKPNRLVRAKNQLKGLIHRLRGDRVGIISFAGTAFIQCPLTLDYGLAQNILDTIDYDSVPVQGTAIGEAIRTATNAFDRSAKGEKLLILLTDGEDHETDPLGAASQAAKAGLKIYAIGIGSEKGEPIRLANGSFKKDKQGHTVNSRLDLELLQKIAQLTGGKTIKANPTGSLELDAIYGEIGLLKKQTLRSRTYTIYEERFQYFLLPVILFLLIEMLINDRKKGMALPRTAVLILVLPLIFGFKLSDSLSKTTRKANQSFQNKEYEKALEMYKIAQVESPESPELHFNIGSVLLKETKYEEAIKEFEQAAALFKDPARIADSHYNIGVAEYRMAEQQVSMEKLQEAIKELEGAMASNQQAMKRNPNDQDPKYNYEQSKRLWKQLLEKLKQQNKEQQNQKNEQKQQEQQNQDEQKNEQGQQKQQEQQQNQQNQQKSQEEQEKQKQEQNSSQQDKKQQEEAREKKTEQQKQNAAKAEEKKEESPEAQQQKKQEAKIGEMSEQDALRLLSTLSDENKEALKEALKRQYKGRAGTQKDW